MVTILRPLSTSELLDRTFHLYRNNFWLFVGIAAIPQLFVFGLHIVDAAFWLRRVIASQGLRTLVFVLASFLAIEISHAATVGAVSDLYLSRRISITKAYSVARSTLLRVIGIGIFAFWIPLILGIVVGVLVASASVAILAATGTFGPGTEVWIRAVSIVVAFSIGPLLALRWWLAWALVVPITVIEGGGLRASIRRSRSLTKGRRGRIFVIYFMVAALTWVIAILFQTPFYSMVQWTEFLRHAPGSPAAVVVSAAGNLLSTSLVGPLLTVAFTLIYYDERVRREGFDLQLMMTTLENPTPGPSPAFVS